MLVRLKRLLEQKGKLSRNIIDEAYELPCHTVYLDRFGSLRDAYSRIGYHPDSLKHQDGRRAVVATLVEIREEFVDGLEAAGCRVVFDSATGVLTINGSVTVSIVIARCHLQKDRFPRWAIGRPVNKTADLILVVRMDEANDGIWEYFILPPEKLPGVTLLVGERNPANINAFSLETIDGVIAEIQQRATRKPNKQRGRHRVRRASRSR